MDKEWKNSLRERFSDYSEPEPEGLWEGIEQGMAEKKRRKLLPVWLVSGAAVAAAVALVVFLRPEKAAETPVDTVERYVQDLTPDTSDADTVDASEEVATVAEPAKSSVSKPASFAVVSRHTLLTEATPDTSIPVPVSDETIPDDIDDLVPVLGFSRSDPKKADESVPQSVVNPVKTTDEVLFDDADLEERVVIGYGAGGRGGFSVGAYRSGGQEASEQSKGFGLNQSKGAYRTRSFGNGKKQDTGSLMEMLSSNKVSSYEEHHDAPVRVGVTFAWEMTPHLSLASGLNWTSLNSTFEESTSSVRNFTRQELGYLGVPLRLEAGFQPWKGLRLYAGAGGMVEKSLMAHSVTSYYVGDYLEESVGHHLNTGGLLWSVGASAGAEYRFNRVLGLYFAPGLEYHFDNGAAVKSAYTMNQLHWNVSLGVRFNFGK